MGKQDYIFKLEWKSFKGEYCRCKIWFFCSREFLKNTDFDITDIATFTGYNDASYFTQIFRKSCGMTPSEYRILERKKAKQNSDI